MTITTKCPTRTARDHTGDISEMIRGGAMAVISGDGIPQGLKAIKIRGEWFVSVGGGYAAHLESNWNKQPESMEFL